MPRPICFSKSSRGVAFWVTELMGQGVNGVSSRLREALQASGSNRRIAPYEKFTIASNLNGRSGLVAVGDDIDTRGSIHTVIDVITDRPIKPANMLFKLLAIVNSSIGCCISPFSTQKPAAPRE